MAGPHGGGTTQVASPRDARLRSSAASLRQVTNRVALPGSLTATWTTVFGRSWQISYVDLAAIQIVGWNGYSSSSAAAEAGPGAAVTVQAAVEYPAFSGNWTAVPIGGATTPATVADKAIWQTDLFTLPTAIPAFKPFRIGIKVVNAAGGVCYSSWSNLRDGARGDEFAYTNQSGSVTGGNVDILSATVLANADVTNMIFPALVLGSSDRVVWGVIGDSLFAGVNDQFCDPSGGRGFVGRALAKRGPHVNHGIPGDKAVFYAASNTARKQMMLLSGVTKIILGLGVNDIMNDTQTQAQLTANRATIRGLYPGVDFAETTITPVVTSTDAYATAAAQTTTSAGKNTIRIAFNNALRSGAMKVPGVIDVARVGETSTANEYVPTPDGGVWLRQYMQGNGDGTHPQSSFAQALEPIVGATVDVMGG